MIIHLKPGSKVDELFYGTAELLTVKSKAPAQDGKANAYLVNFLAKQFGIAKSDVTIVADLTSQYKRVEINVEKAVIQSILKFY